jgi:hypothetical protein
MAKFLVEINEVKKGSGCWQVLLFLAVAALVIAAMGK